MEDQPELQAKLDRTQAEIERCIGHLAEQRALLAEMLAEGEDLTQFGKLLA
jgi:hypothetical protein